jgi:hypothetical protein
MEEHQVQNDLSKPIIKVWEEIYDKKQDSDMIMNLPFIFPTILDQSTSIVHDSFKEIPLHLLQFNIIMLSSNIFIKLFTWRISVLISILVFIVGRKIIIQMDVKRRRRIK